MMTGRMVPSAVDFPRILVFDSGAGGLTVYEELRKARPDAHFIYVADDAGFPYGGMTADVLLNRVVRLMANVIENFSPDLVVIACNTASTLVLPVLREHFSIPFIGTVPAIKPAAEQTISGEITILATPGTVARDYTHDLIKKFAGSCHVHLIGSTSLAAFAELELSGASVKDEILHSEIAPVFIERGNVRTDTVVLACTHYPLLVERFKNLSPWPVTWIDPSPAIARRMVQLIGEAPISAGEIEGQVLFTSGRHLSDPLKRAFLKRGLRVRLEENAVLPLLGI